MRDSPRPYGAATPPPFDKHSRRKPMLVLTRREGETLLIGADVRVTVVRIKDTQVQLGIEAPREIVVLREEIAERE